MQKVSRHVLADNAVRENHINDSAVTSGKVAAKAVTAEKMADGTANKLLGYGNDGRPAEYFPPALIQHVYAQDGTLATINGASQQIPGDNTKPQNTEGVQVITCAITPKSAASKLRVRVQVPLQVAASNTTLVLALFRDNGTDAIGAVWEEGDASTNYCYSATWEVDSGAATATTFKLRVGPTSNVNVYLNGGSGTAFFGGLLMSSMSVDELI